MQSERLARIRAVGRVMKVATWLAAALLASVYAVAVLSPEFRASIPAFAGAGSSLGKADLALVMGLGFIPLALSVAAMMKAAQLFAAFQRGEVLEHANGRRMISIGGLIIAATVAGNVANSLIGAYVSYRDGAGTLTIALSSTEIGAVGSGILILVMGWVIAEAADLADEHRKIV